MYTNKFIRIIIKKNTIILKDQKQKLLNENLGTTDMLCLQKIHACNRPFVHSRFDSKMKHFGIGVISLTQNKLVLCLARATLKNK